MDGWLVHLFLAAALVYLGRHYWKYWRNRRTGNACTLCPLCVVMKPEDCPKANLKRETPQSICEDR